MTLATFSTAIKRIVAGLQKKSPALNPREREAATFHEMGHALLTMALPGTDPVHKVSSVPRGMCNDERRRLWRTSGCGGMLHKLSDESCLTHLQNRTKVISL